MPPLRHGRRGNCASVHNRVDLFLPVNLLGPPPGKRGGPRGDGIDAIGLLLAPSLILLDERRDVVVSTFVIRGGR